VAGLPDDETLQAILDRTNEENRKKERPEITFDDVKATYGHFYRLMMSEVKTTLAEMGAR